jgi:hypothetical protein
MLKAHVAPSVLSLSGPLLMLLLLLKLTHIC